MARPVYLLTLLLSATLVTAGCCPALGPCGNKATVAAATPAIAVQPSSTAPSLPREDFNRLAARLGVPLFWTSDAEHPRQLDPNELVLLGMDGKREDWITDAGFTDRFTTLLATMVEMRRREAVVSELDQGRPTLVHTDFSSFSETDQTVVRHITAAAAIIEELYAIQDGSWSLRGCMAADDAASRAMFARNQNPWCQAPATEDDTFCNACPSFPAKTSGLYPAQLMKDPTFCDVLGARKDGASLFDPFTVVRGEGQDLRAVPYTQVFTERMRSIAEKLRAAAALLGDDEKAFVTYLQAAATSFETNDWKPADEAWSRMNASNSKWYLRIAPDEVYFEPCNRKAGFHTSFALIDKDSLYWQERLTPLRQEMEQGLADLIGDAYAAREVAVHIPDFIEIILNAGDARSPMGATIGQSLPNWGPVAEEGRGRTVVMTNLYTDPDSLAIRRAQAASMFSAETMAYFSEEKRLGTLDIILHEITHNFGPHSDFKIDGKRPGDVFGGAMATVLEELKAQTGALYFIEVLVAKGLLTQEEAYKVYQHSIAWAFGHISRGMWSPSGKPKPYSQLAGIQVGWLSKAGVLTWEADQKAANGSDTGRFTIHYDKMAPAVRELMAKVGHIKASGDLVAAKQLVDDYITGAGAASMRMDDVKERLLRFPKASFVYSASF